MPLRSTSARRVCPVKSDERRRGRAKSLATDVNETGRNCQSAPRHRRMRRVRAWRVDFRVAARSRGPDRLRARAA
jgi:hypothetical protein